MYNNTRRTHALWHPQIAPSYNNKAFFFFRLRSFVPSCCLALMAGTTFRRCQNSSLCSFLSALYIFSTVAFRCYNTVTHNRDISLSQLLFYANQLSSIVDTVVWNLTLTGANSVVCPHFRHAGLLRWENDAEQSRQFARLWEALAHETQTCRVAWRACVTGIYDPLSIINGKYSNHPFQRLLRIENVQFPPYVYIHCKCGSRQFETQQNFYKRV